MPPPPPVLGLTRMEADADFVGSLTLVAVMTALVAFETVAGGVYTVGVPLAEEVSEIEPSPVSVQFTLDPSFTVGVMEMVPVPAVSVPLVGLTTTEIGGVAVVSVTVDAADFVLFAVLVAVIVMAEFPLPLPVLAFSAATNIIELDAALGVIVAL